MKRCTNNMSAPANLFRIGDLVLTRKPNHSGVSALEPKWMGLCSVEQVRAGLWLRDEKGKR